MLQPSLNSANHNRLEQYYQILVRAIALTVTGIGTVVLIGWFFGIEILIEGRIGYNPMRFNVALCLAIAGTGLWLIATEPSATRRRLAQLCGLFLFACAFLTIAEHAFGLDLHIDQFLWKDTWSKSQPGRMVPVSVVSFALTGIFLLLVRSSQRAAVWGAQIAAVLANLAAQWAVLDVIFRSDKGEGVAVHTAGALFALSIGMILAPTPLGFLRSLVSMTSGGRMIRRLLPTATIVPLLVGWISWQAVQAGLIRLESGIAIIVAWYSATLLMVAISISTSTDSVEQDRMRVEKELVRFFSLPIHSLLAIIGSDGCFKRVSSSWPHLLGFTEQELIGRPYLEFVDERDHVATAQWAAEIAAGHFEVALENRCRTKRGEYLWLSWNAALIESGLMYTVVEDITERKQADDELHQLAAIVDSFEDAITTKTLDGVITSWSRGAERLYGYTAAQAIGQSMMLVVPSDLQAELQGMLERLRCGEYVEHHETVRVRKDGRRVDVSGTLSPIKNSRGEITGISAIMRDITERKQAERELRRLALYSRNLIEASLDPLVTINRDGKITDVNAATERITGVSRDCLIGSDFCYFFTEPLKAREGYEQVFATGSVQDYPLIIRHASGKLIDVLYNATLFRNESGEVQGVFAAARDVTERKRAEQEIRELNEQLEQKVEQRTAELAASNKELEAFSYSVSHDLRAPLRHMDGFLTLLRKRSYAALDPRGRHYIDASMSASARMATLIDDLLQFSRLGRAPVRKVPVKLNEMHSKLKKELQPEIDARKVHWNIGDLPPVMADQGMIYQVFQNLLLNALKFTRPRDEAEIAISATHDQAGNVVIAVADNGVGFDMTYYAKLFQVFQRLHAEDEFEGTGIGLANVKKIVERHGGKVWAQSKLGKGATFYVSLPPATSEIGEENEPTKSHIAG